MTDSDNKIMLDQIEEVSNAIYNAGMRQVDKDRLVRELDILRDTYKRLHVKKG